MCTRAGFGTRIDFSRHTFSRVGGAAGLRHPFGHSSWNGPLWTPKRRLNHESGMLTALGAHNPPTRPIGRSTRPALATNGTYSIARCQRSGTQALACAHARVSAHALISVGTLLAEWGGRRACGTLSGIPLGMARCGPRNEDSIMSRACSRPWVPTIPPLGPSADPPVLRLRPMAHTRLPGVSVRAHRLSLVHTRGFRHTH